MLKIECGLIRGLVVAAGVVAFALQPSLAIDHDADGMSDVWERIFEAESLLPDDDMDGDGFSNRGESLAWTDPFSPHDKLELRIVADGSEIALEWDDVHGVAYGLEASSDLGSWATVTAFDPHLPVPDPASGGGLDSWGPWMGAGSGLDFDVIWGLHHGFFGPGGPDYFLTADPDLDGLSNLVESYADTDPFGVASIVTASLLLSTGQYADRDWDHDGIPNGWEADNQLDPLDASDAVEDPDNDVLSNYEEYLDGRDPHFADTQKVFIVLHNEGSADSGWYLRRERWDLVDGWVDNEIFDVYDLSGYIDHVFGERYRYTMVPGSGGGAVPDTEFIPLPHGDQPPYWQEETPSTQQYVQNSDGSYTLASPGSPATTSGTYPYPPNVFPVSTVRTFQLFRPHLNLPPCLSAQQQP